MADIRKAFVRDILNERETRYGSFIEHAFLTQRLKEVMQAHPKYGALDNHHKEALEMIQHKIGRILNGDPNYRDSWDDIAGYAQLVSDIIAGEEA